MRSHPFDPVSAVLALIALVAGILVVNGATVPLEGDVAPWFAVIALIFGLLLLPWTMFRRRSRPAPVDEADRMTTRQRCGSTTQRPRT